MLETSPPEQRDADPYTLPEEGSGPSNRTLKRVAIGVGVVALAVVAWGAYSRIHSVHQLRSTAADAAVQTVSVVVPKADNTGGPLVLPGNIQAYNSAQIYARTSGYVRKWLVDIGDNVRAGQTLAILDAPEVEQELARAKADYQTARANQALSATTAKRWNTLLAKDAVSQQETDEKRGDLAAKIATSNASLANVRQLQAQLGFTRLTAPFAGVVSSRATQIGALIMAGSTSSQPLFTISDNTKMRIYVRVPQNYSSMIMPGIKAHLTLPEYPNRTFTAILTRTSQAVDQQSGSELVELIAANDGGALKPGAYAQVRFDPMGSNSAEYMLPGSAILYGNSGPTVAVVDSNNRVAIKPVKISRDEGATVYLSGGVGLTDRVIDTPPDAIRNGDQVRIAAFAGQGGKGSQEAKGGSSAH